MQAEGAGGDLSQGTADRDGVPEQRESYQGDV
jgi:hypothetical protein